VTRLFRPAGTAAGPDPGVEPIRIMPDDAGWSYCGLEVLRLRPGDRRTWSTGAFEAAILPLSGSCSVDVGERRFALRGRDGVFSAVSDVAYVPIDSEVTVHSERGGSFAVPMARATRRLEPRYVAAIDVPVEVRGAGICTRQVNNFMAADVFEADRLIAVEVLTPSGNWSSYPPHKHDELRAGEVRLEEIYYFEVDGSEGFGLHRTYTTDGQIDETVTVRTGDVFLIPRGYHGPCVAAPEHDLYYLNVMGGPDERAWCVCYDAAYAGVMDSWTGMAPDPRCPMTRPPQGEVTPAVS
jgi:5-deoxy-glucuronate isomerase